MTNSWLTLPNMPISVQQIVPPYDGRLVDLLAKRWNAVTDGFEWRRFTDCYWETGENPGWRGIDTTQWRPEYYMHPPVIPGS